MPLSIPSWRLTSVYTNTRILKCRNRFYERLIYYIYLRQVKASTTAIYLKELFILLSAPTVTLFMVLFLDWCRGCDDELGDNFLKFAIRGDKSSVVWSKSSFNGDDEPP